VKNQRACLLACLEDKSFCNGKKESWRSKKSPLNATKHDQNMAFFGPIMQKYYPGGRGKTMLMNEDRNRRRSIKPKVIILSQIAKKQSMEICTAAQ
jgi:hypothetical protein